MTEREKERARDRLEEYGELLHSLLSAAFSADPFGTICTVLRVGGASDANWDAFDESRAAFEAYNWVIGKAVCERGNVCARRVPLLAYCQAVETTAVQEMTANLLRCAAHKGYTMNPFSDLWRSKKAKPFFSLPPSANQKFRRIKDLAVQVGQTQLCSAIESFFDERVRNAFSHSDYVFTDQYFRFTEGGIAQQISVESLDRLMSECFAFYGVFLQVHKAWLLMLGRGRRFHKWPNYEVLEVLSSEHGGVYGFQVHFSNGSAARYTRRASGVEAINIAFDNEGRLTFLVGTLNELEAVWKISGEAVQDWSKLP